MNKLLPFREHHLLQLMEKYEQGTLPLDYCISQYFRANKAIGSKDRAFIADHVYAIVRWQGLLDYVCAVPGNWQSRLEAYATVDLQSYQTDETIPPHIRVSCPEELFNELVESHGAEVAFQLCLINNTQAPTAIRANSLKISREDLAARWEQLYPVKFCEQAPDGLIFQQKMNFFTLPEFKQGLFEVQDEGSQLLAALMKVAPGQQVMDYCAGSGGKTLAFGPLMQNTGQIFLHDIRKHALIESRQRLKRAGIQIVQQVHADEEKRLKQLKKKMDWVLVDAPCSGVGTLRRNPDMKWKFTSEMLSRLVGQQRVIFEKALSFVKPGGHIVYGTCSVLAKENQQQVDHFLKTYQLELVAPVLKIMPKINEMDGFFGAVFKTN